MIPDEAIAAARLKLEDALGGWFDDLDAIRQILEAAAPYMLTTVSTVRELEALPRLSVIRTEEGTVYERHTMWHEAGSRDLKYTSGIALPATVLYDPEPKP